MNLHTEANYKPITKVRKTCSECVPLYGGIMVLSTHICTYEEVDELPQPTGKPTKEVNSSED